MINKLTLLSIVLMAATTYVTRVLGYLYLQNRTLSPRMLSVMESVPGCVLLAVIAPAFVSSQPANLLALAITLLASCCFGLLPTVLIGVTATGLLRHFFGI
jgi:uncharacterized membrane protein